MVRWALLALACSGRAEPTDRSALTIDGAVLALDDGRQIEADTVTVQDEARGSASGVRVMDGALRIEAPRTQWDLSKRIATMSGGVVATRSDVRMECAEMVVHFSGPDRVDRAVASGSVRVTMGDRRATGDRAVLTTADGRIAMTGSPTLSDGANHMAGDRIVLWMDDERVDCDGCRMRIDPDALAPALGADPRSP
jgi:lipopolysaccharide export system protein LptA